jgi:hypothetical protein
MIFLSSGFGSYAADFPAGLFSFLGLCAAVPDSRASVSVASKSCS